MTDIAVHKDTYAPPDRAWLLFEATGNFGPVPTDTVVLDFTKFTAGTHYPDGYLPAGLVLGKVTSGGRVGPYDNTASDGRQTAVGLLYNATKVPSDTSTKVAVAVVDSFAIVSASRLPANHGLDAAGQVDLPLIKFRA